MKTARPATVLLAASPRAFAAAAWPRAALLLWVLFVLLVLPTRALTPIDETRYASVAWEMWLRGDFVLPWANGEPYAQKPPLLFWLILAGWRGFGVQAWWLLAVPALSSAASLWLLHRIAARLWPERPAVAQLAPLLLFASGLWALLSAALYFDVLLVVFVLVGVLALLDLGEGRGGRGGALFFVAVAGGLLAKGPLVGINLLPLALSLPWWQRGITRTRWWRAWGVLALSGVAGCAVAAAWLAAAASRAGPAFVLEVLQAQGLGRVVDSFDHALPFWWYLPVLGVVAFPWLWWLDASRALAALRHRRDERGVRLSLVWAVSVFVLLSAISGKRAQYLLGMLPAASLLWARAIEPWLDRTLGRAGAWPAAAWAVLAGVGLTLASHWAGHPQAPPWLAAMPGWLGVAPVAVGLLWAFGPRRADLRLLTLAGGSAALLAGAMVAIGLHTAPAYDTAPVAQRIAALVAQGVPVAVVRPYDAEFQFTGRLPEPLPSVRAHEAGEWLAAHPQGRLVVRVKALPSPAPADAWWHRSGWIVIVDAAQWPALQPAR